MSIKSCFIALIHITVLTASAFAVNRASSSSISIDEPVTEEFVLKVREQENWPYIDVHLKADQATLKSLVKLPEISRIYYLPPNSNDASLDFLNSLTQLTEFKFKGAHTTAEKSAQISMAPLAKCTELRSLSIVSANVEDIDSLGACRQLNSIVFNNVTVPTLEWLAQTPAVIYLDITSSHAPMAGMENIGKLSRLQYLRLSNCEGISDDNLVSLKQLTKLREAHLNYLGDKVTNVDCLQNSDLLETVYIRLSRSQHFSNINGLANKPFLKTLELKLKGLKDITPLSQCPRLQSLELSECGVQDLAPLSKIPMLMELTLDELNGVDFATLNPATNLQKLQVSECQDIQSLEKIASMASLKKLYIRETAFSDLTPLKRLVDLEELTLEKTGAADISQLANLWRLRRLSLRFQGIKEYSSLKLPRLSQLVVDKEIAEDELASLHRQNPLAKVLLR